MLNQVGNKPQFLTLFGLQSSSGLLTKQSNQENGTLDLLCHIPEETAPREKSYTRQKIGNVIF